jgi:RNA polymerase sigma factor (sigma-70 family)
VTIEGNQTHPSLLIRLRDLEDAVAWERFVDLYTPLVFQFASKRGLQAADAADVTQEVMKAVAAAIQKFEYEPARGGFRNWLFTVARSKLNNFLHQQRRVPRTVGQTTIVGLLHEQSTGEDESEWNHDYRLRMFHWAAAIVRVEVRDSTWEAFWQTAVLDRPASEVARGLGLSEGAVYIARSRVIARLRAQVETATGDWTDLQVTAA